VSWAEISWLAKASEPTVIRLDNKVSITDYPKTVHLNPSDATLKKISITINSQRIRSREVTIDFVNRKKTVHLSYGDNSIQFTVPKSTWPNDRTLRVFDGNPYPRAKSVPPGVKDSLLARKTIKVTRTKPEPVDIKLSLDSEQRLSLKIAHNRADAEVEMRVVIAARGGDSRFVIGLWKGLTSAKATELYLGPINSLVSDDRKEEREISLSPKIEILYRMKGSRNIFHEVENNPKVDVGKEFKIVDFYVKKNAGTHLGQEWNTHYLSVHHNLMVTDAPGAIKKELETAGIVCKTNPTPNVTYQDHYPSVLGKCHFEIVSISADASLPDSMRELYKEINEFKNTKEELNKTKSQLGPTVGQPRPTRISRGGNRPRKSRLKGPKNPFQSKSRNRKPSRKR